MPDSRIAAPQYINALVAPDCLPPGHLFFMYFSATMSTDDARNREQEIARHRAGPEDRRQAKQWLDAHPRRAAWVLDPDGELDGRKRVAAAKCQPLVAALRQRQRALADADPAVVARAYRLASPLTTGLGIEHPTENGFAFLWPYGVPYLPGSGIKGVLRRAAEMLATGQAEGLAAPLPGAPRWSLAAVWALFGFDASGPVAPAGDAGLAAAWLRRVMPAGGPPAPAPAEVEQMLADPGLRRRLHARGALEFWDAYPAGAIRVDIMNPHAGKYYGGDSAPAECDSPIPIYFLTVEAKAELDIYLRCDAARLPAGLPRADVDGLLEQAFDLAADWLGFGAKTAVGYGALERRAAAGAAGASSASPGATPPRAVAPPPVAVPAPPAPPPRKLTPLEQLAKQVEAEIAGAKGKPLNLGGTAVARWRAMAGKADGLNAAERQQLASLGDRMLNAGSLAYTKAKPEFQERIAALRRGSEPNL